MAPPPGTDGGRKTKQRLWNDRLSGGDLSRAMCVLGKRLQLRLDIRVVLVRPHAECPCDRLRGRLHVGRDPQQVWPGVPVGFRGRICHLYHDEIGISLPLLSPEFPSFILVHEGGSGVFQVPRLSVERRQGASQLDIALLLDSANRNTLWMQNIILFDL